MFEQFPFVDIAFGPGEVSRLGELVARERLDAVGAFSFDGAFSGSLPAVRERPHQAWVQISVGCNCVCAYCIVPSVRGRERSRPPADVVAEVEALAADGVREVTLLGQNVNSYGRDLPRERRATFAELLRAVAAVEGIWRVRYTSPHPKDMRADVIAAMAECPEVCEHLHLPAQSGSTRVLKAMRRTYGRERYLDLVARLREAIPDLSLTTDLIVGFPGETEDDFAQTLSLVEECRYDGAYTFLYSPRPGTEAARPLPDDVAARGQARAHRPAGRGGAADRRRARGPLRRHDPRGAGRGPLAHRPVAAARPPAPEHRGQLHRRPRSRARWRRSRIDAATSTTLTGREAGVVAEVAVPGLTCLALAGPTAAGKSALAHAAALALGGEIVVADPFQRYRGLEIAADSPRAAALAEVPLPLRRATSR